LPHHGVKLRQFGDGEQWQFDDGAIWRICRVHLFLNPVVTVPERAVLADVRIPIEAGRVFRRDVGYHSDLKPATVPI
jgi:hypothetical protein